MTTYQHSMERVLFKIHHRLCTLALQKTTSRARRWTERLLLLTFLAGTCVTGLAHVSFVHRDTMTIDGRPLQSIPLTCLRSVSGFSMDADVTHISLTKSTNSSQSKAFWATSSVCVEDAGEIRYSFARIQGYLLMSTELCMEHNVTVQHVVVSPGDEQCCGTNLLRHITTYLTGHDTVILNWLLGAFESTGFIYNPRTKTMYDLSLYTQLQASSSWYQQLYSKAGVVLKTGFLFFIVTTLVSFILRETQEHMLEFTHQLQARVRLGRPITHLVVAHLVENLVFVPMMVGMIFFLIEFYRGDKVCAFMILSIVWVCEAFSVLSLRSKEGMHFFPRIFFLEYAILHFYIFMFPFGFSYMALASTAICMTHSMVLFWHRYELPAVALGHVTLEYPRMGAMVHSNGTSSINSTSVEPFFPALGTPQALRHPPPLPDSGSLPAPRPPQHLTRQASLETSSSNERTSRQGNAIFGVSVDDGEDSTTSFTSLLNGEVVVQRQRLASPPRVAHHASQDALTEDPSVPVPESILMSDAATDDVALMFGSGGARSRLNTPACPVTGDSFAVTPRADNRSSLDLTSPSILATRTSPASQSAPNIRVHDSR